MALSDFLLISLEDVISLYSSRFSEYDSEVILDHLLEIGANEVILRRLKIPVSLVRFQVRPPILLGCGHSHFFRPHLL